MKKIVRLGDVMRVRDFLGLGTVWFLFLMLMFWISGVWLGGLGALVAAFLMTPWMLGHLARVVNREKLPFVHRFVIGFFLMMLPLATSTLDMMGEYEKEIDLQNAQIAKDEPARRERAKAEAVAAEAKRQAELARRSQILAVADTDFAQKKWAAAYAGYQEAHGISVLQGQQRANLVAVMLEQGKAFERSGNFPEAKKTFAAVLLLDAQNTEAKKGENRLELATATAPPVPSREPKWFDDIQPEQIFNDVFTYNEQVFQRKVNHCKITDPDATCGGKGDGYIVVCNGAPQKFKWFRYTVTDEEVHLYTLPMNYELYNCNPTMSSDAKLVPRIKRGTAWKCEDAPPESAPPHCGGKAPAASPKPVQEIQLPSRKSRPHKNCVKGKPCGGTCIPKWKDCNIE